MCHTSPTSCMLVQDLNMKSYVALVNQILRSVQFVGLPPELSSDASHQALPGPDVLVIEYESEDSCMLYRYQWGGTFGGDTWHETLQKAFQQAEYEFGTEIADWIAVPGVRNAIEFAAEIFKESPSS